jgi:hypothetical protein
MIVSSPRTESNSASAQLHRIPALAARLLQEHSHLRSFLQWLSEPGYGGLPPIEYRHAQLAESIDGLIQPILSGATAWERRNANKASEWLAAFAVYTRQSEAARSLDLSTRMVASSLLPLYRTLATSQFADSFQAMRQRTVEHVILLGLQQELGPEFSELLELQLLQSRAPSEIMLEDFKVDLTQLGAFTLDLFTEYDPVAGRFSKPGFEMMRSFDAQSKEGNQDSAQAWAHPALLWRLAGELCATRSEMVLPRPWIEVPVPWPNIQEHWHQLSCLLSQLSVPTPVEANPLCASDDLPSPIASHALLVAIEDELQALASESKAARPALSPPLAAAAGPAAAQSVSAQSAATATEHSKNMLPEPAMGLCLPKVMLAEISSTSDPAFMNVMKRRLAACRVDDRSLCVSIVVVTPDDDQPVMPRADHGLKRWQQELVNWIADQPQAIDPVAFLTTSQELILCVHDLEKNELSSLIRRALLRVLGGPSDLSGSELTLSKVNIPARFHAGIAGTSSPGPNLTPEQLVAPAIRCLQAAQQQGKAGIKSIEVY